MIKYYCSTCGKEWWSVKIEVIMCCGYYVENEE